MPTNSHSISASEQFVNDGNPVQVDEGTDDKANDRYANFWVRLAAYIIDVIIIFSINGFLLGPLKFVNNGVPIEITFSVFGNLELTLWTVNTIITTIVYYIYFALFTKVFQQTLGKMIIGIKVVPYGDQCSLTWGDVFFREVIGRILHNVFFILKLMYLLILFTESKRGFHDMIGNTCVVYVD